MSVKLWPLPTINKFSTTLTSSITDSDSSMTLTTVTGLDENGGILGIDRVTSAGVATPSQTEYVSYTAITTKTLSGLARGLAESTAQEHSAGAVIESLWTVTHITDLIEFLEVSLETDGTIKSGATMVSPVINTSVSGTAFLDEDDLTSDSATQLVSQQSVKAYIDSPIQTATDEATVTFDLGTGAYRKHQVTFAGDRILALSNVKVGQVFIIDFIQDATGTRVPTWFTTIKWVGGTAPTLTTTANKIDTIGFICTSTGNYQGYVVGQNI